MFTISQMHDLQAERAKKMAAAHGVGAALALAVQAKAEHDAHTARHERWSNCEFCELATLQAAAEWQQQQRESN